MVTGVDATVALRVNAALEASGRSVKSLAEDSGIARTTLVRKLKAGSFTLAELHSLAEVFGVTIYDLIPHEDVAA